MAELADGLTYDAESLTPAQLAAGASGGSTSTDYAAWFATLPADAARASSRATWGPGARAGTASHDGAARVRGLDLGNVLVAIQPPRGYGDDPVAVYHSPNLPPAHHYLAFYRWLDEVWGADADRPPRQARHARVAAGQGARPVGRLLPDAALGDVPLFYPFVVNDPGEGTQAKRRAHAVVIDHLLPP